MSEHLRRRWSVALIGAALFFCGAANAGAQVTTGNVTGSVQDPQGGVVPGATVTLTSATRGTSAGHDDERERRLPFPNVTGGHLHRQGHARRLQDARAARTSQVSPGDRVASAP